MSENNLNIIIIGSASNDISVGNTPTEKNIINTNIFLESVSINFKLFLIDPEFNYILLNSKYHHQNMKDEFLLLNNLQDILNSNGDNIVEVIPNYYHQFKIDDLEMGIQTIDFDIPTIYISCLGFNSTYEIMLFIEDFNLNNTFFYNNPPNKKIDLLQITKNYNEFISNGNTLISNNYIISPKNLFALTKINNLEINKEDFLFLKKNFIILASLIIYYIKAGFHLLDMNQTIPKILIPNWAYNTETPIIKSIILHYKLKSPYKDLTLQHLMIESSEFKNTLLNYMIGFLSNFSINNNLIKKSDVIDGWFDILIWEKIKIKLEKLILK